MPLKKVTVHYRRLVDRNLQDINFQPAFDAGLAAQIGGVRLSASDAARITTSRDEKRMCLLSPQSDPNFCFGEIAVFRDGDIPIAETDGRGQITLRTIPLGGNEEAVQGSTYFMARGPHFAILHHESSTRFLEDYLRWLLRQPLGNLAQDELVHLQPLINAGGVPVAIRQVKALKIRAEVAAPDRQALAAPADARPRTFARMIDRHHLTGADARAIFARLGMTDGSLRQMDDGDLADLEIELLVRKKERNRIQPLPEDLISGIVNDGLDRAAEFQVPGAKRRGDAVVASFPTEVDVPNAYYDLASVRAALWAALGAWVAQELI